MYTQPQCELCWFIHIHCHYVITLDTEFGFVESPGIITAAPDEEVSVSCWINCTSINWSGCGIRPNAIVIVPSNNYMAHEICFTPRRSSQNFHSQQYNVTATCELGGHGVQLCSNADDITYNVTLRGFSASSLREFVIVCGVARHCSSQREPSLAVNGLLQRKFVVKVESQLRGTCTS